MSKGWCKRGTTWLLVAVLLIGVLVGTGAPAETVVAAQKSKLSQESVAILIGKSQKVNVQKKKKGDKYTWKSNNKKIAKVNAKGKIKGVKKGETKVRCTVTPKAGKKYVLKCDVEVVKGAKKASLVNEEGKTVTSATMYKGTSLYLTCKMSPASSNDKATWKSSNAKVVSVDEWGNMSAESTGTATVTATTMSKKKASVRITVQSLVVSSTLKDAYADRFSMGAAVNLRQLENPVDLQHIVSQYNSITLENEMKPEAILGGGTAQLVDKSAAEFPVPESYQEAQIPKLNFATVDKAMEIAKNNGLKMRGHTLVWHSQTPAWFFREGYSANGKLVTKEVMDARMEFYIQQVLGHVQTKYPGLVYAWDVVNEAFENDGNAVYEKGLRVGSNWYSIYKDDSFIFSAFRYARKYQEQGVAMFYNDFNEYIVTKTDNICALATRLKAEGLIDGIGMQAHLDIGFPTVEQIGAAVDKFSALGLQIQLTEVDVTISRPDLFGMQGEFYQNMFTMLATKKQNGANITNVTFWGLDDSVSWRGNRTPLLFMDGYEPKPALVGVLAAVGK